jgi:hypothetical protein
MRPSLRDKEPPLLKESKTHLKRITLPRDNREYDSTKLAPAGRQNFWIFQVNPDRFDASHWWYDMKLSDQWRINKSYRDKVRNMGIDAMWASMVNEDDIWSIKAQYRENIARYCDLQAIFLSEKFDYWSVFQHKNEIHKGDMAAVWVAGRGDMAGIYGIVEIVTDPYFAPLPTEGNIRYWVKKKDREELTKLPWLIVSIRYIKLVDPPWAPLISRSSLLDDEELMDLIVLRFSEATNLGPISNKQWQRMMELAGLIL